MYHSRAAFKEALKKVIFFSKQSKIMEYVPYEAALNSSGAKI